MLAIILLLPLYTIAAEEEYDEDPTPYDTEEWYRGDTLREHSCDSDITSTFKGWHAYWTENEQWYCSNVWQTYTSSKTKTYHTISSGATTFSTNILTDFKPGDSLVVCKKTTAMAAFDF